jgi:hypothetical protein
MCDVWESRRFSRLDAVPGGHYTSAVLFTLGVVDLKFLTVLQEAAPRGPMNSEPERIVRPLGLKLDRIIKN